jgi:hypothetical protein
MVENGKNATCGDRVSLHVDLTRSTRGINEVEVGHVYIGSLIVWDPEVKNQAERPPHPHLIDCETNQWIENSHAAASLVSGTTAVNWPSVLTLGAEGPSAPRPRDPRIATGQYAEGPASPHCQIVPLRRLDAHDRVGRPPLGSPNASGRGPGYAAAIVIPSSVSSNSPTSARDAPGPTQMKM